MDEGTALLHSLERSLNKGVTSLVAAGMNPDPEHDLTQNDHTQPLSICVCGFEDGHVPNDVKRVVTSLLYKWGLHQEFSVKAPVVLEDDNTDLFSKASHVVLCSEWNKLGDFTEVYRIVHTFRQVRTSKGKFLLLAIHEGDDVSEGVTSLPEVCLEQPEMRMLIQHSRVHQMQAHKGRIRLNLKLEDSICDWIKSNCKNEHTVISHMEYQDVIQIFSREMRHRMPELDAFCRLFLMSIIGTISVLITLAFLFAITKDAGLERDVTYARQFLRQSLEGMRSGKSEWGFVRDAVAVAALQADDSSWWMQAADHQRSTDRLEIGLLAVLTRLPARELTPQSLALYIIALQSIYINPRDFHGHNLMGILHNYWLQYGNHGDHNCFSMATSVIAFCNMDENIPEILCDSLVSKQRQDGSYPLGIDETALVALSLMCCPGNAARGMLDKSLSYLRYQRQKDGSYGSLYASALVLQVFNATGYELAWEQYQSTLDWMVRRMRHRQELRSLEVTAHVLLTMAGKSLLSVANKTAFAQNRSQKELAEHGKVGSAHYFMRSCNSSQSACSTHQEEYKTTSPGGKFFSQSPEEVTDNSISTYDSRSLGQHQASSINEITVEYVLLQICPENTS